MNSSSGPPGALIVCCTGELPYGESWTLQQELREARERLAIPDLLLLVEHPPTYTLGRSSTPEHLLLDRTRLEADHGIEVFDIERGGSATYHGPGQLVGYPIMDLRKRGRDVHEFIRLLEQVLIGVLGEFGLKAGIRPGLTGVWIGDERKIASIGIHVRHWITMHGFALNAAPDLSHFQWIQPCGLDLDVMTSMARELDDAPGMDELATVIVRHFEVTYQCASSPIELRDLRQRCTTGTAAA